MLAKTQSNTPSRVFEVDVLRGSAIVLMIIFHFGYDLAVFGWATYNTGIDIEWRIFRAMIVTGFLLAVGMSSYLAYHRKVDGKKLFKACAKLLLVSVFLTISSVFMYPDTWIYFGIIHFITVALFLSVPFVRIPNISAVLGTFIILGYGLDYISMHSLWLWSIDNIGIPQQTVDLASFIPWFGVVLLGIFVMHKQCFNLSVPQRQLTKALAWLGKHSLVIYLLHQPIIYSGLSLIALIIDNPT
ncbi:heparan-alpha-glucosaminide N-acetyltransferase [Paraglaciecola aquimarina]|uniref:Heparan-alpha-glucosaminide N-acetyltransferase n=1 Tax=Paraglaciecola aquimarina TaxID=1235557 RepID=A0ABU3SYX4_9ALTE|nr:heparan-alpha-glucosaminide N-acetyltransferase [Paraglaciecola aquimarina]MDU0355191.1 heparan-alpha-glucosaminide N-acetyltransferase [Paraglaciecola aquimarina]